MYILYCCKIKRSPSLSSCTHNAVRLEQHTTLAATLPTLIGVLTSLRVGLKHEKKYVKSSRIGLRKDRLCHRTVVALIGGGLTLWITRFSTFSPRFRRAYDRYVEDVSFDQGLKPWKDKHHLSARDRAQVGWCIRTSGRSFLRIHLRSMLCCLVSIAHDSLSNDALNAATPSACNCWAIASRSMPSFES